jgi:hypothetical protein
MMRRAVLLAIALSTAWLAVSRPAAADMVQLVAGCQIRSLSAYPVGTPLANIAADVSGGSPTFWFLVPGTGSYQAFSSQFPQASDKLALGPGDDAAIICLDADATWQRGQSASTLPLPSPPATQIPAPTATPPPPPPTGQTFTFAHYYWEADTFQGTVTEIRLVNPIPGRDFFAPVQAPQGATFAVVFMTVTNFGNEGADVSIFSFTLRDSRGRVFTMDYPESMEASLTAEYTFGRGGLGDTIMPGITLDLVFVFLVPLDASGFIAERCAPEGC